MASSQKEVIAELLIGLGIDSSDAHKEAQRVTKDLKDVAKAGTKASASVDKTSNSLKNLGKASDIAKTFSTGLVTALSAVGFAVGGIGTAVLRTGGDLESLRSRLKTVVGSAEGARIAFEQIRQFAAETPFQITELTDAYIRLKGAGIDPTNEALRQVGDISAANKKSVTDWVEAIKDAQTGEFERLKEFMIKASKDGDKVRFTFRGITTEVENNEAAIQKYLLALGDLDGIAGGMADRMNTLEGATSNLTDAWESFLDDVAQKGPLEEAKGLVRDLIKQFSGPSGLSDTLSRILTRAIRAFRNIAKSDLVGTIESAVNAISMLMDNIDLLIGLFLSAKTITAFNSIATGLNSIGIASTASLGPLGAIAAALVAITPIAMRAGEAIGNAFGAHSRHQAKNRGVMGGAGSIGKYDKDLEMQIHNSSRAVQQAEARFGDNPSRSEEEFLNKLRSQHEELLNKARGVISEEEKAEAELKERNRADLAAINMAEAKMMSIKPRKEKKKKGKKKKKPKFIPTSVAELMQGAARGDLGRIASRDKKEGDIDPSIAMTINNYNFRFENDIKIRESADGKATASNVAAQMKEHFQRHLAQAGQSLSLGKVR